MATGYQNRGFIHTPELSISDSEDSYTSSDEEMPDCEETNQLLRQAHHYVITEGGKDSASLYIDRIQRINRSLIHEISRHGYDCDPKLYRRVKQKIDHVLREFEDAVDPDYSIHDYDQRPEHHTTAAEKPLYRTSSSPVTPGGPSAQALTKRGGDNDVQRTYLYGGPDSHPEIWHKKAPASLIFPETIRMAEWESLRVHWDLATTGDMERRNPVTSNSVSYNDPRLERFNHLSQFESGTRYTLPTSDPAVEAKVNEFCTVARLTEAVGAFSQNDDSRKAHGDYEYAPCVFLDKLEVGQQASPTDLVDYVRKALNTTPSKPRQASASSSRSDALRTVEVEQHVSPPNTSIKPSPCRQGATSAAVLRIKAATEASIRTSTLPQSPVLLSENNQALPAKRPRGRPRKITTPVSSDTGAPAYQTTASGKRKRLSVDVVDKGTQVDAEVDTVPAKRARTTKEPARPYTPIMATQPDSLHTPVVTPALTMGSTSGSSVASTPPVVKARTAGKKQRKIRTKKDFEERVTAEKYAEVMTQREKVRAQGDESVARRSTRSGKPRAL